MTAPDKIGLSVMWSLMGLSVTWLLVGLEMEHVGFSGGIGSVISGIGTLNFGPITSCKIKHPKSDRGSAGCVVMVLHLNIILAINHWDTRGHE